MESTTKNSNTLDWLLFLVFFVVFVLLLMYASEWFWLSLPFMLTYLVRAMRAM